MRGTFMEDLLALLPNAAAFAKPPISNFRVGAIARGTSGKLYYGTNVEFAGEALSFTVHAEQSAVVNAWMSGETGIDVVATSAAPCGYCRQFLNELVTARELLVVMPNELRTVLEVVRRRGTAHEGWTPLYRRVCGKRSVQSEPLAAAGRALAAQPRRCDMDRCRRGRARVRR
jgi:cytidine deaminase